MHDLSWHISKHAWWTKVVIECTGSDWQLRRIGWRKSIVEIRARDTTIDVMRQRHSRIDSKWKIAISSCQSRTDKCIDLFQEIDLSHLIFHQTSVTALIAS